MPRASTVGEIVRSDMVQSGALRKRYWQSSSLPFRVTVRLATKGDLTIMMFRSEGDDK
ncbi:DUF7301 family protein [Klebsiella pneumoniae]|uniref:DUF7301 family protein n=1 Tax=Klebsiella pneumoniae TaxID=573 RepID=UPI003F1A2167